MPLCKRKHAETELATHCLGRTPPDSVLRTEPFGILFKMPTTTTKLSRNKTSRSKTPQNMHVCMKKAKRTARDSVMDRGSTRKKNRPPCRRRAILPKRASTHRHYPRLRLCLPNDLVIAGPTQSQKNLEHHEPSSGNRFESNSHRPHDSRKVRRIPWGRQGPSQNSSQKRLFEAFFIDFLAVSWSAATLPFGATAVVVGRVLAWPARLKRDDTAFYAQIGCSIGPYMFRAPGIAASDAALFLQPARLSSGARDPILKGLRRPLNAPPAPHSRNRPHAVSPAPSPRVADDAAPAARLLHRQPRPQRGFAAERAIAAAARPTGHDRSAVQCRTGLRQRPGCRCSYD